MLSILFRDGKLIAGPPFLTDDPEPVELHHWEFYVASQSVFEPGSGAGSLPHFEVNYGAVPDVQLHILLPLGYTYANNSKLNYGISTTELGVKYRFLHETDGMPQIGTFPFVEVPTGNKDIGLSSGYYSYFLPLWMQKTIGKWTTYGGAGWWINPGAGNRNWLYAGWLAQYEFSDIFTAGGELYYHSPQTTTDAAATGFNLGGYVNIDEHKHVLYSVGRNITGAKLITLYIGYQATW